VVDAVGERRPVIVVGHSLGGFTAPLACARIPVDLLVLVAAMIPSPGELFDDWWANAGYAEYPRWWYLALMRDEYPSTDEPAASTQSVSWRVAPVGVSCSCPATAAPGPTASETSADGDSERSRPALHSLGA
jgi:pimeloyl-ACP methyl ester carboxylesterase